MLVAKEVERVGVWFLTMLGLVAAGFMMFEGILAGLEGDWGGAIYLGLQTTGWLYATFPMFRGW